ncbi:MAG TPA: diacylglycerol kinase family protein [Thermoanaerobaculia bacterium]|nr:diacylglycerol kinase family protein [Thermoanaerobaculia bacterium]
MILVHNTRAGDGLAPGELRRAIEGAGHQIVREIAKGDEIAVDDADRADVVAIAGGDGTVGDVARALAGRGVPLAPLPLGTANNIARSLGVSGEPEEIASGWNGAARRVRFDLGAARGPWGQKRFLEGAGVGLVPAAIAAAQERGKKRIAKSGGGPIEGARRVFRRALKELKPSRFAVTADGERLDGDYLLIQVLNIRSVGPNLVLSPEADPGDGFLDLVLAGESEREALRALLEEEDRAEAAAALPTRRVRGVEISRREDAASKERGAPVHVDDDLSPSGAMSVLALTVQPGQVEFLV